MVSNISNAALYGFGVFTTVRVKDGRPLFWEKHWARLTRDSAKVGIGLGESTSDSLLEELQLAVAEDAITDGRARITIFDETTAEIWSGGGDRCSKIEVITAGPRAVSDDVAITASPFPVNQQSPLAGVKSCNYLENILAKEKAAERGFNEAVRVNTLGSVTSGCMANIFWLKDGTLHTPLLSTGCLPGTTREYILEKIDCRESVIGIDELRAAEAIFLTSAGLGVVQVCRFDDISYQASGHPVLSVLT